MKPDEPVPGDESGEEMEEMEEGKDSPALRALLKRSLDAHPPAEGRLVLEGVQKKLRERSKGKFYGDGWSTTQMRTSYALVAMCMLVVIALVYFALGPTAIR